ncbi:MAG: TolC family protein, partial [Flavobacteriaceae bacterium]
MNYSNAITGFLFFLLTIPILAQQKWSLDDCVSYALQHNLQLNDFQYNERSERETYRQSIRNLLPSVNGATNYVVNFGRSTD